MQFAYNLLSNWQYFAAALLYLFLAGIVKCVWKIGVDNGIILYRFGQHHDLFI